MADETVPAAPIKPGYKTSEFWLSTLALVVGAIMSSGIADSSPIMKVAGLVAVVLSAMGYTGFRSSVKKAALILVMLLPLFAAGCHHGYIDPKAIEGLNSDVCDRHDALISGKLDPKTISEADKATFLRSSALLRQVIKEAEKK